MFSNFFLLKSSIFKGVVKVHFYIQGHILLINFESPEKKNTGKD